MQLVLTDKQMEYIEDKTRHLVVLGSAGSGKTIFASVKVILYAIEHPNARIGVFRQTLPSLKKTAWLEIRKLLDKLRINYKENKSDAVITLDNGSTLSFIPLDDSRKVRSLNLDFVYIEQCEEISKDSYDELTLRVRGEVQAKDYGQILSVVQPESKSHWLYQRFYIIKANDPDYKVIHFSYLDNPYLSEDARKYYDSLKELDPDKYLTHTLGQWIVGTKQIFTNNWSVGFNRNYFDFYVGGIDFGWNVPSCFLLIGFYDDEAYVIDEVYAPELTNDELLDGIREVLMKYNLNFDDLDAVYGDSASPDRIEVLCQNGLNTYPSVKDVKAKIQTTRETKIHISENCENLIRELPEYQYKMDKDSNILDEPIKQNDHAVDALCYCVYGVRGELSKHRPASSFDFNEVSIY